MNNQNARLSENMGYAEAIEQDQEKTVLEELCKGIGEILVSLADVSQASRRRLLGKQECQQDWQDTNQRGGCQCP